MIKKILKKRTHDGINKIITCNICGKKHDKKHLCQLNFYRKTKDNPVVIDLLISEYYEEDKQRGKVKKEAKESVNEAIESVLKNVEKEIKDGKLNSKKRRSKRRRSKKRSK